MRLCVRLRRRWLAWQSRQAGACRRSARSFQTTSRRSACSCRPRWSGCRTSRFRAGSSTGLGVCCCKCRRRRSLRANPTLAALASARFASTPSCSAKAAPRPTSQTPSPSSTPPGTFSSPANSGRKGAPNAATSGSASVQGEKCDSEGWKARRAMQDESDSWRSSRRRGCSRSWTRRRTRRCWMRAVVCCSKAAVLNKAKYGWAKTQNTVG
mmetsp:Transcript_814/g.1917  ORF Transcript_814/g.1917 Transcript_814/m.1917 type:complete len:211 (+) Transcript_814:417-1049(+)